jgi:hypothetical protein
MSNLSTSVDISLLLEGDFRLDATYYESSVFLAKIALKDAEENGIEISSIKDFSSGTFNPPPIKRAYTDNKKIGTPYMLPQEMFDFYWTARKHVVAEKMPDIDSWFLKEGWVVLTQSGSVGKPYFASKEDERVVLSQNAIRIPCEDAEIGGYIYAFLSTWIGQTLLKKDEFGITVKHIRPNQVDEVPIPNFSENKQRSIGKKVKRAFELRQQAIKLLDEAKKEIYDELGVDEKILEDEHDA